MALEVPLIMNFELWCCELDGGLSPLLNGDLCHTNNNNNVNNSPEGTTG
jgi:hypothetical protein